MRVPFQRGSGGGAGKGPGGWWIASEVEVLLHSGDVVRPDVMRWSPDGYVTLMRAERGESVHPETFEAIELEVGTLFGDDPP